jgi:hypothetical protein
VIGKGGYRHEATTAKRLKQSAARPKAEGYYWVRWGFHAGDVAWTVAAWRSPDGEPGKPVWWFPGKPYLYSAAEMRNYIRVGYVLRIEGPIPEPKP